MTNLVDVLSSMGAADHLEVLQGTGIEQMCDLAAMSEKDYWGIKVPRPVLRKLRARLVPLCGSKHDMYTTHKLASNKYGDPNVTYTDLPRKPTNVPCLTCMIAGIWIRMYMHDVPQCSCVGLHCLHLDASGR